MVKSISKKEKVNVGDLYEIVQNIQKIFEELGIAISINGADISHHITRISLKVLNKNTSEMLVIRQQLNDKLELVLNKNRIRLDIPIDDEGLIGIEIPNLTPIILYLEDLLDSETWKNNTKSYSFMVGKDIENNLVIANFEDTPNILIAGNSDFDRSIMLDNIVISLMAKYSSEELQFVILGNENSSLYYLNNTSYLAQPIALSTKKKLDISKWLLKERQARRLIVIIDGQIDNQCERLIEEILDKNVDINFVFSLRNPKDISKNIKKKISNCIVFFSEQNDGLLLKFESNKLVGNGDAMIGDGVNRNRVQCAYMSKSEVIDFIRKTELKTGRTNLANYYFETALKIATVAHSGQVDKNGKAYILHPLVVASKLDDMELKTIAILHDTIEDTYVTPEYLIEQGIPENIVEVVELLTKPKDVKYEDYLKRIKQHPKALAVKLADLAHNTDPDRAEGLNEARRKKYELAKRILQA